MSTIKSSFKKLDKTTTNNKCHFGHPQFDAIFNANLSKGHLMIMQQDHPTMNYLSLLRYYISSNYNSNIPSLIYDTTPNKWSHLICPVDKKITQKINQQNKQRSQQQKKQNMEIAWRYDKMKIKLNQLVVNQKINFLDLNKTITKIDQTLLHKYQYPRGQLIEFYEQIQEKFLELNQNQKDTRPKKILLASIPSYFYQQSKFAQFIKALRCLTRSSHVFTLITLPPIISEQIRKKLIYFSDYYIKIDKVGKGYKDFNASISVLKQNNHRGVSIWGIKNKKKQFRIQSLYEQAVDEGDEAEESNVHKNQLKPQNSMNKSDIDF